MNASGIRLLIVFFVACLRAAAADSLYIDAVKRFAFREANMDLKGALYTEWEQSDSPFFYVYVSRQDSVAIPPGFSAAYVYCHNDRGLAERSAARYRAKGLSAFCYRSYANSGTLLNRRLVSYSNEVVAFIVFHELIHVYIMQQHIRIPYDFNEALCDVIGNYGTLAFARATGMANADSVRNQTRLNEQIYALINNCIAATGNAVANDTLHARCTDSLGALLQRGDAFKQDRFGYTVNNAFLLKNSFYSKNYFLLKQVLLRQKSIRALLDIAGRMPQTEEKAVAYLEQFR